MEKAVELSPDVVTLDVEMPVLDGISCLERIMRVKPGPVIMVSSHTRRSSAATIKALQLGAVDFVTKPQGAGELGQLASDLQEKIMAIARRRKAGGAPGQAGARKSLKGRKPRVVVIGSSTGGTVVLTRIVNTLPAAMGATLVAVQHMPAGFTAEFARNLSRTARCGVREARDGDLVAVGDVFIAPGAFQCSVYGNVFRITRGEAVSGYMPSIDVTMRSAARRFGPDTCGVLLTGIGRDGSDGIREIHDAGGCTIVQDESTSAAFGMPKAAIATGKVDAVLTDDEIVEVLAGMISQA